MPLTRKFYWGKGFPHLADVQKEGTTLYDIDVFCESPFVIMECTSYLNKTKLGKIHTFSLKKKILEAKYGTCEAYFVVFDMDDDLKERIITLCSSYGIKLIDGKKENLGLKNEKKINPNLRKLRDILSIHKVSKINFSILNPFPYELKADYQISP